VSFGEDDLLPLSGLQHLVYCPRQAALVHLEGAWADNRHTVAGKISHRRVHESGPRRERRGDLLIVRGLSLRSLRLGIVGVADVVEFHRAARDDPLGARLHGMEGRWRPVPVEYKRGRPKPHRADEVQVCAQGICLEEMLGVHVPEGLIFYGRNRRREGVKLDEELRRLTEEAALAFRRIVKEGITPAAEHGPRCRGCSLEGLCLPRRRGRGGAAARYVERSLEEALMEPGGAD